MDEMNSLDIVDRWLRLKEPEKYAEHTEIAQASILTGLEKIGVYSEAKQTGRTVEDVLEARELAMWEQMIREQGGMPLLKALGLSVPEFVDTFRRRGEKARGGRKRASHLSGSLDKALAAFLAVEQEGGSFTDAVKRALTATQADRHPPTEVTIRGWLQQIAGRPWSAIPAPTRGRPKKKSNY